MGNAQERSSKRFGLIGKDISYSFSQDYFSKKFEKLGLEDHIYQNFDLKDVKDFTQVLEQFLDIKGLNVTIPYKEQIIPYLNELSALASEIGAVNTIQFKGDQMIGHNTDHYGFTESIRPLLQSHHLKALILGTGGASKAVFHALRSLGIRPTFVSRRPKAAELSYHQLCNRIMADHLVIVNCTPLGTHPNIQEHPNVPYDRLTERHLLFDLIYNPAETTFLRRGREQGATTINGLKMLELQAEKAWEIWNDQ
ncbi:shikimate dehydrogenase family protein [Sungkyunkwania multivorans]|uniref:Shikimate dehydrogenase family protein n=1 Tax=Sungkyunkwania multivorans TaxID=1173618 RepID=A0ABW3CUA8_9FLAO